ncbi:hypothetical protein E3Q18_00299 [Wallemia mellicola]|uniref:Uncharacterized protein n=2 Tax=Opisthokonta TaxID=33154 RepID=A0A4T0NZZ1_9BASI|nr:hypothetical protein E3Q24_01804 [Wallemia mellicola]TIB86159.1 hypothetical protein E3Q21_01759 [Wallemia mellicola]TIB89298.1 hypothetical protein E3Q20_01752 [Wallemia mellicola]TIC02309.1 hypothetical protein E3Q18_00299 [Wallemia mellicola]TIC18638.1 hypothetical protein E3Q13_01840 [Wallemia mellicola]
MKLTSVFLLTVTGLTTALPILEGRDSGNHLIESIKKATNEIENVNARTIDNVNKRDFNSFIEGVKDTGNDIKNVFNPDKRDFIDDVTKFGNQVKGVFEGN